MPLEWLSQCTPLWALLIAFATNPYTWSDRITSRLGPLLDRVFPQE